MARIHRRVTTTQTDGHLRMRIAAEDVVGVVEGPMTLPPKIGIQEERSEVTLGALLLKPPPY